MEKGKLENKFEMEKLKSENALLKAEKQFGIDLKSISDGKQKIEDQLKIVKNEKDKLVEENKALHDELDKSNNQNRLLQKENSKMKENAACRFRS